MATTSLPTGTPVDLTALVERLQGAVKSDDTQAAITTLKSDCVVVGDQRKDGGRTGLPAREAQSRNGEGRDNARRLDNHRMRRLGRNT